MLEDIDGISISDQESLIDLRDKSKNKLKELKSSIQSKLDEINNSKNKLSKLGFKIDNNFENVDNFLQAHKELNQLQKDIENHLSENIFDKDTIKQSIDDLANIQRKRKDLIAVYNHLNTKNGREKFDKEVKRNERAATIKFLKEKAKTFLHNQGLEIDKDTEKEIENNVDLQVKEDDSEQVKAQKEYISKVSTIINQEDDLDTLDALVAHLKQYKETVNDTLKVNVNTLIAKAKERIIELQQTKKEAEKQKKEDGKKPYFSNINELFSLFNNEQQENKLASIANNPNEKDLRKRITFTLTDLENPKSIEQAVADLKEKDNQNVISLSGVRGNNKPFNFQMKVDGELIGGFQMPNQIYLKINDKWSPIDFSKLKEDGYLEIVLGMLFPSDLISTIEDRKVLGQYLTELNSFSNKLNTITQRGDISFEDFNNLTNGQINLNSFSSQIEMNFTDNKDKDGNIIETRIEDTLDDPDNVLTKAATKTIKVNGEDKNIVIFGKSTGDGQGFSKLYFVNIINGKLERNEDGTVLWRDRDDKENSEERKAIQNLVSYKKENAISTKGSLFSLLVFNSNGYIQPIFTSNETISKLKGLDNNEEFIVNFLNNEKALLPALQIMSEGLSSYYEEYKDKTKKELDPKEDIKNFDLFLSVTGLNKTEKVKVTPFISTYSDKIGQLSFELEINGKKTTIASSIYFDGQNFFKSFAKGKEELDPINKRFEKGEITLGQKIEEIKKFRHEVLNENKLNEEIASLILKDSQYSVLGKLRKATNVNATINGFYTNVLLNKNNQQSLENLVTKKKLGYNLYLRPDRTQVKEITSTRENIRLRNEKQQEEINQQQKAKEQIQNKEQEDLFNENTVKLEAQEEAKTIIQVVESSPTPSAELKALEEQPTSTTQSEIELNLNADLPQGKVGNTNYEVKGDNVYFEGKKLDNPENKTHKQLIEADIKRRRQEALKKFGTSEKQTSKNSVKVLGVDEYVSRELMELAYSNDSGNNPEIGGGGQTLNRIIERGGYSKEELSKLLKPEIDKINAKYDAELAALEPKIEVKQTPNIDKLEELGVNFEQLPKEEDLLSRVYRRSKISEKGLSLEEFVQIVTNAQNEAETEGANKLLELSTQDLIEYNTAIKNLSQILPIKTQDNPNGTIEVTDLIDILGNLKTKGEVGGRFIGKLKTIYLATKNGKSVKGFEYHEAFHAVFRLMLDRGRIIKTLNGAESLYGTPTKEQLQTLKESSSDLINLSQQELKNLWLEEKMADAFMEYMKAEKSVTQSWLRRIFERIKNLLKGIFDKNNTSNERAVTQLFSDIYQGKFKNAKEKFPVIRNVNNSIDVNKLLVQEYKLKLTNGKYIDKKGYLSYSISEAIINTITNEAAKILKNKGSKIITDDEISDIYDLFRERFNPNNEVIADLIDSIKDDDLANKTASKYLNVYKSLGNLKNQEIVVQEVFERLPLYNLVNESSILQEQLDDSDDLEDDELNDTGIVQKSKNEINHAWDKASKKVKQYISSVSTNIDLFGIGKPFDDYIVNDKSKNYSFAINGNHLYSNLTKMLVGAPAYKHLGLLYSVSNTSPEIKAFTHQWYKDIYSELKKNNSFELPEINVEDFAKLYEILSPLYYKILTKSPTFSFISSDFEKNRTYLQDVLFSKEGVTRMLNANNRNVGKQVFSRWERNWNSKRIDNLEQAKIDFKANLYKSNIDNILQKYVDLLENTKSLKSQEKSEAVIALVNTFKSSFSDLGIELPEQFIKYNLINFVFETGNTNLLTNEEINWYNNFSASDIKPINLEFLDGIEKTLTTGISFGTNTIYNDIDPATQKAEPLLGAVGKLMDVAESTALFDTSIIPSSFNNQEGKRIFDITPPSDISRRLNILKDKDNVQLIKEYLETKDVKTFKDKVLNNEENGTYYLYSFFTEEYQVDNFLQVLDHNPLFNNVDIDTLFTTLTMAYAGGIRQEETNVTEYEDSEDVDVSSKNYGLFSDSDGKSYNNADTTAKILYRLSLLADSAYNKYNLKVVGKQKYAYYIASQYESASTIPMVLLPFNNFIEKGKINEKGLNSLYSIYNQEVERIKIVQSEIDEYYLGFKKDGYNEGFHYMLQNIGVEGTNGNKSVKIFTHSDGTYFYLDIDNNNNVVNLSKEELYYNEKQEDGSTIKKEINLNSLIPKGLKLFNFANKNTKLNEKDLSEEEIKQRLSNFIDFQVDEYIKLLEDKGLLKEGEVNLLPKSFISGNQLDKNALKNAFLNDYLMSYGINSLMYGDNATSSKNANDFVKRAKGMIGSGSNYGSGVTNIIPIRSEVVNKIDTTDAQTFNTPFHHLSVILNSKSIDNRIKEIYQGIDSGLNYYINSEGELQKITKEDYDYLYDNNAQHQPNKTQGFGLDWYLKTSISPILRETTSRLKNYSKENLKEALLIHKELFDLKLQASPSDNAYITYLTKKYQNLFEAIPGKEYKHNLLNELELNNAIAVYDSAWKRSKYNIHEISNGQPFLYKNENGKKVISSISVPNASLIDQQKTDGVKKQITHPTQFLRLISTEQINETLIYFKNKEINIGTALNVYEKQLAERTDKGFKALKKEMLDENGDAEWDLLLKSFIDSIEKSSADPQQLELFQQGNSSKPKYNLNNPAIETKFQSMFLSFVSGGTLKQKVAGSKLSLMSSVGSELEREIDNEGNVIKTFTTRQSKGDNRPRGANIVSQRLRHDVYDKEKHEYYSEIVVSERFLKKFGFTADQFHKGEIPQEFLYISGVRIPTEDKHSMINCKIVDILPDSYGNAIMLPNEIVELSGADFDIDALYVRVNQTYTNVLNKKTGIYGSYLFQSTLEEAKEQAYNEYLSDAYDNKKISSTFNDLKTNSKELIELTREKTIAENSLRKVKEIPNVFTREQLVKPATSELLGIIDEIKSLELTLLEQSFIINKIIFNKGEWTYKNKDVIESNYIAYQSGNIDSIEPLTKGETNNMLLELERKLINNDGNNKITNTPTSLKLFKDLIETLEGEGLINKDLGYGVHDMLSKTLADISISTGAANIGPVALFNNLFGILFKNKVTIERKVGEKINLEPFVNYSRDENNKLVDEKDAQRVQDSIATLLAAMTDNAKEQMANLFNLTTETLPVALAMIGVGHNFNNVMLLMKSPIVKKISELSQSYNKTIQSKQDYDDSKGNRELQKKVESIFQLEGESEFEGDLNYQTLLDSLKNKEVIKEEFSKGITFLEEQSTGYKQRTIKNASADATIAIAVDFTSAGERLTKSSVEGQSKKYIPIDIKDSLEVTPEIVDNIVEQLNETKAKTLNIAGNGIYTMKGKYTQEQLDDYVYELLQAVLSSPDLENPIERIRTGGQTGLDEAGAKAGFKLNLPTLILAPKGWTFRNESGQDISNEQQFKERFGDYQEQKDLFSQEEKPVSNQKAILKRISNEYFHYKKASTVFSNLQNLLQLIKGFKSTFAESEKFITALNNLGWSVSENGLDIVKNDKPTDKFYKNYKDTTKIIGNGVGDIFEKDKFLKQSIKTALALTKLSEKYFISQTPTAKKTREDILTLFKDYKAGNVDFQSNLRKHYLSYLTVMAYAESVKNTDDKLPKIEEFLLTPLEEIAKDNTKENNELQTNFLQIIEYNYKNGIKNDFLEFLEIKNIDYLKKQANKNTLFGYRLNSFTADARKVKNPDNIARLISGFNELYFAENDNILEEDIEVKRINTLKTKFAKDMFKYLVVKDGLMFQNQSFIKAIDPILFTETSNALDKVQELFSKMSSSKEYIETFGMSKEELNLDFIIKFGLNQNNYFDLKSQKIDVLRKVIDEKWIKDNKIESEDFVNDNESDTNEKEELVLEDNYPIFFDSKNNTLVVNQFARITKGMKPEQKSQIKKENKKFILRDEIVIFKKIAKTYKSGDKIIPYSKIGFPIITYLSGKNSARIPLKLTAVQDSIQVDGSWINFQISPEGKVLELSNSSKESLKGDIYYGDLFNNTIYEIINNDAKLKTYKNGRERLVNIAKAIANQFENGYIEGTKALYNQHIILGSGEISSLTNSIKDQLDMVLSPEQTEKVKMNMFNKTKEKAKDETEVRLNFINLINQYSAITKVTLEGTKNRTIEELERVANNFMVKAGKSKQEIEDKTKKCYSLKS